MSQRRVGLAIGRKSASIVGVRLAGRKAHIEFSETANRDHGSTPVNAILPLLEKLPAEWRTCEIAVAISAGDLACADCFEVPFQSESQIETVAGSLAESRCAGFSAEDLAIDLQRVRGTKNGTLVQVVAASHSLLRTIQDSVKKAMPVARLKLVTAIPVVLSQALTKKNVTHAIACAGEGFVIRIADGKSDAWRSFPLSCNNAAAALGAASCAFSTAPVTIHSTTIGFEDIADVPAELAPAVAAAMAEPRNTVNLLRGAKGAPRSGIARLRGPLALAGSAAALMLVAIGYYFDTQAKHFDSSAQSVEKVERQLWERSLPGEPYKPNMLTIRLKKILAQRNKVAEANKYPSALVFWSEMASVMPNADQIGMSMESLQLGTDGGRMTGRVNKGTNDPLSNASLLESALNKSESVAARGEFETRESDIVVRMRLDYRQPNQKSTGTIQNSGGAKP